MFLLVILVAFLPVLLLLFMVYRQDKYQREPVGQIIKGFCFGMLSAIAVSLLLAIFLGLDSAIPKEMGFGKGISTALFRAAIPEELSKFFFLWLLLRKNPHYNEYVDGIVYAACVGMGFAAFENVGYLIEYSSTLMATGLFRALFPVPGHLFFAVAMGYYYSCYRFGDPARRKSNLALAIVVPILLHFVYDAVLMVSTGSAIASALIFLFLGFFVFLASRSKKRFSRLLSFDMSGNGDEDLNMKDNNL